MNVWFDTWSDIWRVVLVGTAGYATLVVVLRVAGKRALAKLNAFDLVVTVAFGSTLATILLSSPVSWSEGAAALLTLAGLQFLVSVVASRVPRTRSGLTSEPTLLVRDGELVASALHRNRVAVSEVRQAVRSAGTADLSTVAAVVLETDGTLSVISASDRGDGWALDDVEPVAASRTSARSSRPRLVRGRRPAQ